MLRIFFQLWWLACFAATHYKSHDEPKAELPLADKAVHFFLFLVLSWSFARLKRDRSGRELTVAFAVFLCYAAADEITQYWVGRGTEALDFAADALGVALGLWFGSRAPVTRESDRENPDRREKTKEDG